MQTNSNTQKMVLTALMMGLIIVAILFIRIPIPFTQGYVHPGDAMVFLSVLVLGRKYGVAASGLGGMLGDLIGGFAMWAPWTLVIKGMMAFIMGTIITATCRNSEMKTGKKVAFEIAGMVVAGVFMVAGYYAAEGIMYGNWVTSALGVPWNAGQAAVGMLITVVIAQILRKSSAKRFFTYK